MGISTTQSQYAHTFHVVFRVPRLTQRLKAQRGVYSPLWAIQSLLNSCLKSNAPQPAAIALVELPSGAQASSNQADSVALSAAGAGVHVVGNENQLSDKLINDSDFHRVILNEFFK